MAMNKGAMAASVSGCSGLPQTPELVLVCDGIINELTVNGSATFGSPICPISGLSAPSLAEFFSQGLVGQTHYPMGEQIAQGIVDHIMNVGKVSYPNDNASNIYMYDGKIINLDGTEMASLIESNVGAPFTSPIMISFYVCICTYIMANAQVDYGVIS